LSLVAAAPNVLSRLVIGGNLNQGINVGGSNNTGPIGNIIDNSDNNGVIKNTDEDKSAPASLISIGGENNQGALQTTGRNSRMALQPATSQLNAEPCCWFCCWY
jgi:hypothetical protein